MPIAINGSGTITGISVGGIPDGVVDTDVLAANAVTAAKLGSAEASGLAKAWVNFDGTGTVAIRASYNVSSITDNGVGNYTVNFTTAMVDANYSALSTTEADPTGDRRLIAPLKLNARTTSSVGVWGSASGSNVPLDTAYIAVAIFR